MSILFLHEVLSLQSALGWLLLLAALGTVTPRPSRDARWGAIVL
ncbi:hypothetical protein EV652_111150 [Kribbella steppae]|uniref:Uncharacterized protein n=1 Tax=Kribbella steppae TaxID=2512223 RepID=A0A4R2H5U2_9ACTN|nr:hypothetical protein [Kribbella steppae]TCO21243.1 hypothetical protein EV652_111150 [Kribbella steppae]